MGKRRGGGKTQATKYYVTCWQVRYGVHRWDQAIFPIRKNQQPGTEEAGRGLAQGKHVKGRYKGAQDVQGNVQYRSSTAPVPSRRAPSLPSPRGGTCTRYCSSEYSRLDQAGMNGPMWSEATQGMMGKSHHFVRVLRVGRPAGCARWDRGSWIHSRSSLLDFFPAPTTRMRCISEPGKIHAALAAHAAHAAHVRLRSCGTLIRKWA